MGDGLASLVLQPAVVLSLLVGAFHTSIYVFISGRLGWHILAVLVAATLGAFAGQALGARVGGILMLGDYSLLWASALAWLGIGIAVVTTIRPAGKAEPPGTDGQIRSRRG